MSKRRPDPDAAPVGAATLAPRARLTIGPGRLALVLVAFVHLGDLLDAFTSHNAAIATSIGLIIATCLALWWFPRTLGIALALTAGGAVISVLTHEGYGAWIQLVLTAFAAGRHRRRSATAALVAISALWALGFAVFWPEAWRDLLTTFLPLILASYVLGHLLARGAAAEAAVTHTRQVVAEERRRERLDLARELHENVAGTLTMAKMHAALLAERDGVQGARQIEALCGESLEDLRRLMRTLSTHIETANPIENPPDTLAEDAYQVTHECATGLRNLGHTVTVELPDTPISGPLGATIVRVLRVATANIAAHVVPPARCDFAIRPCPRGIRIRVSNTMERLRPSTSTGLGLPAISERVEALGGTIEAGPTGDGTWCVDVYIPTVTERMIVGSLD